MAWKSLAEFSTSGTNIPIEWLEGLRFTRTYSALSEHLDAERELKRQAYDLQEGIRTYEVADDFRKAWQKVKKHLALGQSVSTWVEKVQADESVPRETRQAVAQWERAFTDHRERLIAIEKTFEEEFERKREVLWTLAQRPAVQEALFHLNPDFLERLRPYFTSWRTRPRDKGMRERERTLMSYLARLCAKNSTSGPFGPSSAARWEPSSAHSLAFQWNPDAHRHDGIGARETFISHWVLQDLVDRMAQDRELCERLPLTFHPVVCLIGRTLLAGASSEQGTYLPKKTQAEVPETVLQALGHLGDHPTLLELVHDVGPGDAKSVRHALRDLLDQRFLVNELWVRPGDLFPCETLSGLLDRARPSHPSVERWKAVLKKLESLRSKFAQSTRELPFGILREAEEFFTSITSAKASRGEGAYYADRFMFYEDCARDHSPIAIGGGLWKEIFENYTLGLELLAPLWLFRILAPALNGRIALRKLQKKLETGTERETAFRALGETLSHLSSPELGRITEELKEDDDFVEWFLAISGLVKSAEALFSEIAATERVVVLSPDDPRIVAYRKAFREAMTERTPSLPVFASGPGIEIASRSPEDCNRGDFLVIADSIVFGNFMHLMILNYFVTRRDEQLRQTEDALCALTGNADARPFSLLPMDRQSTKFSPWIGPGIDIEFQGPSSKTEEDRATLRDLQAFPEEPAGLAAMVRGKKVPLFWLFPLELRVSRKLLFESFKGHFPRIQVGKCVLQRENWLVAGSRFDPGTQRKSSDFEEFLFCVRVQRELGLPDRVFADPSGPKKNILVDFQNFFSVDVLTTLARGNESFRISEMLPDPGSFWLPSADGQGRLNMEFVPFLYYDPTDQSDQRPGQSVKT